jgi:hypothetical protein
MGPPVLERTPAGARCESSLPSRRGFIRWIALHNRRRLKATAYYVVVNAAAILVTVVIAALASSGVGYWLYLYAAALLAGNSVSHLQASYQQRQYCPASVSGAVVLIPLLLLSAWQLVTRALVPWPLAILEIALGFLAGLYILPVHARHFASTAARGPI